MLDVIGELLSSVGRKADAASATGSVNAKLGAWHAVMPQVISSIGPFALGVEISAEGNGTYPTLVAWMGAGRACYIPFRVVETITVTRMVLEVGVASGNISMGIYDSALARLVTTGAIACPAAGFNVVAIPSLTLNPGRYYMAMSGDNTTMTIRAFAGGFPGQGLWGFCYENIHPLPAAATPGASASVMFPSLGVSQTGSIV